MPIYGSEAERLQIKNYRDETRLFQRRILLCSLLILGLACLLFARFYDLQIVNYQTYATHSDRNRIQVQPVAPTRGLIYDRNGVLLAENRASYVLSITKERVKNLDKTLDDIAQLIHLSDADRDSFQRALKRPRRPYEPIPLRLKLTEQEISIIAVNEFRLQGVQVTAELVRHYPHGELFAHTIGYVGRINGKELSAFDEEQVQRYSGTHSIGKLGLEKYYEDILLGSVGSQQVETNAHGRMIRVLERQDPEPGRDIYLHLDIELQQQAMKALGGKRGAVVAIDVETGGVLALASSPSFDPNLFVTGIGYDDYEKLNKSNDLPLFNRTIQGQYPPGSTLKPMLGLGALNMGIINEMSTLNDPGYYQLDEGERIFRDWKKWGHGSHVDLHQAIAESCNTFFYDLSYKMGIDRIHPLGERFGLGLRTGIDIPNERVGLWPSRVWKKGAKGLPWFPGDSLNVGVGQGFVLATPMQLAVMTATIASGGDRRRPILVDRIDDQPVMPVLESFYVSDSKNWQYVSAAMESVIHGKRGTARRVNEDIQYKMAGKSGTAQLVSIAQDTEYDRDKVKARNRDQALFIAFAPVESPQLALAVVLENGESGSGAAAPVVRQVFDAWFNRAEFGYGVPTFPDSNTMEKASAQNTTVEGSEGLELGIDANVELEEAQE